MMWTAIIITSMIMHQAETCWMTEVQESVELRHCSHPLDVKCDSQYIDRAFFPPCIRDLTCSNCSGSYFTFTNSRLLRLSLPGFCIGTQQQQAFRELTKTGLQELRIHKAKGLQNLQHNFLGGIESLRVLDLRHNHINLIPSGTFNSSSDIGTILLSHNDLGQLAANSFSGLTSVGHLHLSDASKLTILRPQVFSGLKNLQKLIIQRGPLRFIHHGAFRGIENVKHIQISYTELSKIVRGAFDDIIGNVELLDLSHNQIEHIEEDSIPDSLHLKQLNLQGNNLKLISADVLPPTTTDHLTELNLRDNPTRCDCRWSWITELPVVPGLTSVKCKAGRSLWDYLKDCGKSKPFRANTQTYIVQQTNGNVEYSILPSKAASSKNWNGILLHFSLLATALGSGCYL